MMSCKLPHLNVNVESRHCAHCSAKCEHKFVCLYQRLGIETLEELHVFILGFIEVLAPIFIVDNAHLIAFTQMEGTF